MTIDTKLLVNALEIAHSDLMHSNHSLFDGEGRIITPHLAQLLDLTNILYSYLMGQTLNFKQENGQYAVKVPTFEVVSPPAAPAAQPPIQIVPSVN